MDPYEACGPVLLPPSRFRTNNTTHISPFNSSPHGSEGFPVEEQEQQPPSAQPQLTRPPIVGPPIKAAVSPFQHVSFPSPSKHSIFKSYFRPLFFPPFFVTLRLSSRSHNINPSSF